MTAAVAVRPAVAAPVAPPAGGPPADGSARLLPVALTVATAMAAVSYHRVFAGTGWIAPVAVTVLATHLACALTAHRGRRALAGLLVDLLVLVVAVSDTVLRSSTTLGLPLAGTWRAADVVGRSLSTRFASATMPVPTEPAFLLPAVLGVGVAALISSWLVLRLRRPLLGLVPSFAVFVVASSIGTRSGRTVGVVAEVVGLAFYGVAERAWAAGRPDRPGLDGARSGHAGRLPAAAALAAVGVGVAAVVTPGLPAVDGRGPAGWRSAGADGNRVVISPLVSLQTRLLDRSTAPVFAVSSDVASYWRLTSLDDFDGTEWGANDNYADVGSALPGVTAAPGTRQVTETFTIRGLDSVWLPLAFDPERIHGGGSVSWDERSGSLLSANPTSNGLHYTVTSVQYLATLSPTRLAAAARVSAGAMRPYLALPAVPADIRALARRIVAGAHSEYAKALALQDYFYGPEFTYSLHPPSDGSGTATLQNFLFSTRTGYCQQFAGAYAVLARLDGLPTRLAVGFTTGTRTGPGTWEVTDADAHTWPEVWFPGDGWVPFEPTKGSVGHGFAIPGATAYTGDTATLRGRDSTGVIRSTQLPPQTPLPTVAPAGGKASTPSRASGRSANEHPIAGGQPTTPTTPVHTATGRRGAPTRSTVVDVAVAVGGLLAAALLLMAANVVARRTRWRRRRSRPGTGPATPGAVATLAAWDEVLETLGWQGLARREGETFGEFARRAGRDPLLRRGGLPPAGPTVGDVARLAELSSLAAYGRDVPDDLVEEALATAGALRAEANRRLTRRRRLRLLIDPRLAFTARPARS